MFKKLKDKLAEEVKSSPARIQHFAQAAQAAVSSASSTISDTTSNSDKFFSIAEEDSPQNSPYQNNLLTTTKSNDSTGNLVNFKNGQFPEYRKRTLSNSSLASDISFRLPIYEAQASSYLQSDLESASEFEDFTNSNSHSGNIHLEKLQEAYRRAIDRNNKFKEQYTDVIRRYRQLEKDNSKARTALVETQDKALRRISELREQCSLEQRAKAHLESALRLEMDDMQCVIKTLKTKLSLVEDNKSGDDEDGNGNNPDAVSLISFIEPVEQQQTNNLLAATSSPEDTLNSRIKQLEASLAEEKCKVIIAREEMTGMKKKFEESQSKIKELMASEEQNTILLAENKMMIHSELEKKELEVKQLEQKLTASEKGLKTVNVEKKLLEDKNNVLKQDVDKVKDELNGQISAFKKQIDDLPKIRLQLDKSQSELESKTVQSDQNKREIDMLNTKIHEKEAKIAQLLVETTKMTNQNSELTQQMSELKKCLTDISKSKEQITQQYLDAFNEINSINSINEQLQIDIETLKQKQSENSESDELKQQLQALTAELSTIKNDNQNINLKLEIVDKENATFSDTVNSQKSKIDTIKMEKRDLEKTLEKEIREKSELKVQVTNILQEIGRLEEQLNELRYSYAKIEEEKRLLEEKTAMAHNTNNVATAADEEIIQARLAEIEQHRIDSVKKISHQNTELQQQITALQDEYQAHKESFKKLQEKLTQCLDENTKLFNGKELMDHEYRSLQDQCETKEKEKLCVLDTNKCLEIELEKLQSQHRQHVNMIEQNQIETLQLRTEITELTQQICTTNNRAEEMAKNSQDIAKKLEDIIQLECEIKNCRKENVNLTATIGAKEIQIQNLTQDNEKIKQQIHSKDQESQSQLCKKELEITQQQTEIVNLNGQLKLLQEQLTDKDAALIDLQQNNTAINNQFELDRTVFDRTLSNLQLDIDNWKVENTKLDTQIQIRDDQLKLNISQTENEIAQLKNTNIALTDQIQQQQEQLLFLQQQHQQSIKNEKNTNTPVDLSTDIVQHSPEHFVEIQLSNADDSSDDVGGVKYLTDHKINSSVQVDHQQIEIVQHEKTELEMKLKKIMHEVQDVSNRNLFLEQKCENYLILEQSNERLKLQNDKLSRQLDDTLVSLHLTEGITANTEFEYLKNIMFQYLTTNLSANTGTLVKVIAAVLKFTPQQTQVALERESQRHTLLGQINNLL